MSDVCRVCRSAPGYHKMDCPHRRIKDNNMSDEPRKFGPKPADHPSVGKPCPACHQTFVEGDYTTLIVLGPGADPEAQARAAAGRSYKAIAAEVHWACATGETP